MANSAAKNISSPDSHTMVPTETRGWVRLRGGAVARRADRDLP